MSWLYILGRSFGHPWFPESDRVDEFQGIGFGWTNEGAFGYLKEGGTFC